MTGANTNRVTTGAFGTLGNIPLPFIGTNGRSACEKIISKRLKQGVSACGLTAGEVYTYSNSFPILNVYPSVSTLSPRVTPSKRFMSTFVFGRQTSKSSGNLSTACLVRKSSAGLFRRKSPKCSSMTWCTDVIPSNRTWKKSKVKNSSLLYN